MSKLFLIVSTLLFAGISSFSQDFYTSNYNWSSDPLEISCPDSLKSKSEVNLLKKIIAEYGYNNEDEFIERYLYHRAAYLGSDEAIEGNNRIYLPVSNDEKLEVSKARTISPEGKVIELDENDINSSEDEDGNLTYYYAFKGLVKGSIIEYFYIQTLPAEYSGERIILQNDVPQLNFDFKIISPWNLVFSYNGLNGFGEMESDTTDENRNHLYKHYDYIPKYISEDQAFYQVNAIQVVYKLSENLYNNKKDIISYSNMADYIINTSTTGSKTDLKIVSKWIKESGIKNLSNKEDQIRGLEVYLKKSIAIVDAYSDDLKDLSFVAKNKITNPLGLIKSIAIACKELNIQYEVLMTCDRSNELFDAKFESYSYLDTYLMYFPEFDKYLDPNDSFGVIGIIDYYLQDNYAAFFQRVELGDFVSGVSQIKFMEGSKANDSRHDMIMDVAMNEDFSALAVDLETKSSGYFASAIQPYYGLLDPDDIETANKAQVSWISETMDIKNVETKNTGFAMLGVEPFIINSTFTVSDFVSVARDKYLLKLGLLIGPQTEMYQESKRTKPVNSDFRKFYHREIKFTIPEGYTLGNLESISINVNAEDENGVYAGFTSSYTIEDNLLVILCDEFYEKVQYKVSEFEDYRAVINSAADFNKLVIYLSKE